MPADIAAFISACVPSTLMRCIAAGASDYLPKPIDTPALLSAVTRWLLEATENLPQL